MNTYRIGYCTSGFASHRLEDALGILADLGYRGVFITLDVHHLDPFAEDAARRTQRIAALLGKLDLVPVVETGARFILDPWRKHLPNLLSQEGAARRKDFLMRAIDIAADLGAPCISTWAGHNADHLESSECWDRLLGGLEGVVAHGDARGVGVAFEPEPGMFIETTAAYKQLKQRLGSPASFGLSLDLGHVLATGEGEPVEVLLDMRDELMAVAIEDMKRGVHEHLPLGEGDMDLDAVVDALATCGFEGVVAVELARHHHEAVHQARRSRDILMALGVPFREA